ncbi:MAG: hypothetical protein V1738_03990 [Patescibacteria group bacterium]
MSSDEAFQWFTLAAVVVLSLAAFVIITQLAWLDNVLLFRHWSGQIRHYRQRIKRRWRMWREPGYRTYQMLIERFEGPVMLVIGLQSQEEMLSALMAIEDLTEREHRRLRDQIDGYRTSRRKCSPFVVEKLTAFTDEELETVAEYLAGFDYDHRPADETDRQRTNRCLAFLKCQRDSLRQSGASQLPRWLRELERFVEDL